MSSLLAQFHPAVRAWFERRFGSPSRVQEMGWPAIGESQLEPGHDVLLCAPTGSGKTLAAFMWAINRLVMEAETDSLRDEVSVLYVSPLKALANDIRLNLDEPLDGVRAAASEMGTALAEVRAALRTGDTTVKERGAMLRKPPHILVTTPESLFILLTSPRFREKLRAVRYVIVDELHALAGNKRGAHLALTLERLERMVKQAGAPRPARIGLSATLNPIERLAQFLAGAHIDPAGRRAPRPVRIVRADDRARQMDLRVLAPGPELGPLATHQHWDAMYDAIAKLIDEHRTTLVFTLSRRWAERVALNLQKRVGTDAVLAHHGSLARKERLEAEQRLKRGELKAIVATASLELGIDVGAVELVCQIDSPKSISAAIQRVGRSGHSLGATPKGRFFAMTSDDLLECAAAVRAIRCGQLDEVEIPSGCLDVAAQQIVAIAAEEGEIGEDELLALLRSADNFAALDGSELRRLLHDMASELPNDIRGARPKIFFDRANRRVRARRGARIAAITSGGTIPESGNYDVVVESQDRKIGDVEEDFAQESVRGDVFSLGSMPWQIQRISRNRLMVEPAPGMAPSLPFWQTEAGGRSPALSAAIWELREALASRLGDPEGAARWLTAECAVEEPAAAAAVAYVRRGVTALGAIPSDRTIVVERFFDGLGGTQIVIHSPLGIRLNRGLGLAMRKRLCQSFDFEIQASATDDGVLLALNSRHSFALEGTFHMLSARAAGDVLVQAMIAAPMFEVRLRHVATRSLTVMRSMQGRKVPAWMQRLRSQELIAAIFPQQQACFENRPAAIPLPGHFIVRETIRECLEESTDLRRMNELLRGIESGSVRVLFVDAISPSVFAHRLLLAWDYSFLDDGERANRRSRTVTMNRGMAEDVFRKEDLSAMLSTEVVGAVTAEVSRTAANRRARDREELYEVISSHGMLTAEALEDRACGEARVMLADLEAQRRIIRARLDPAAPEVVIAVEDCPLIAGAYRGTTFNTGGAALHPEGHELDPAAAREELARRALRTSGPATSDELASRLRMAVVQVASALAALEARGTVFRGHFTRSDAEQWCDRYVLEKIHRMTLARVRAEIEPCEDHEYAAFRLRWSHIGGADLPAGQEGLGAILEQLSGVAFAPQLWERSILPARIPGYRPEDLDLMCMSGAVVWAGAPDPDERREVPSKVAFIARRQSFLRPSAEGDLEDPRERAVYDALISGGAQYLDQLTDRAQCSERDALKALWALAAAGRVSNDSFAPLRTLFSTPEARRALEPVRGRALSRHDAALRARLKSSLAGRWSAIARPKPASDFDETRELALVLLARHGILSREMLALESIRVSWSDLAFALRRLEYGGTVRRGWFVRSLSGEQYALPEALDMLRSARSLNPARERPLALSAADPANPYGALVPGCGIAREPANLIVIRAGRVVLGLAGRALLEVGNLDDEAFSAALAALAATRHRLVIEMIGTEPALKSARVGLMASMRFHSDGRALVCDGLPGPLPARATVR